MHQAHAPTENIPVHQCQHRLAVVVDAEVEGVFLDEEVLVQPVAALVAVVQRADITASAEGTIAGAIELALQQADHVQGQGIEAGGAVEGKVTDIIAHLRQYIGRGVVKIRGSGG